MRAERREAATELRVEGRRLTGPALLFGETSPSHRERIEAGAFAFDNSVVFNLLHDPLQALAWHPGGGLELRQDDEALHLDATLPPIPSGDLALQLVREGQAKGLSVEFHAVEERREAGIRIVSKAALVGIGLVRRPSYPNSRVEAREARGRMHLWL
ncbi:MAG: HK97 family phage prohead protease [Acidimicrobiaceae bacterium]|nr:HK97 family phage prohead protease [Acidimicrobiaceae bacterium]